MTESGNHRPVAAGNGHVREAAIVGLGIISTIGCSLDEVAESLRLGRSGIVLDSERHRLGFRSALTGRIRGFDPQRWRVSQKLRRMSDEPTWHAYAAATDAIADAGFLRPEDLQNERCGIIFGNDSAIKPAVESIDILRNQGSTHFIGAGYIFSAMNSTVTMNLAATLGMRGANWTVSAACASSAHAIGQAMMLIRGGLQDIVVVGGAQEINWQAMASFDALGAFSTRHDRPESASRPFDADRDGLVPSGGAACLVMEDLRHARARGARVYGVVRGYGFSSSGQGHLSQPNTDGAIRAIRMALASAEVRPDQIDYINAHATSTPVGDLLEARAIHQVFGDSVPVSSTKSMTGHECWMAGASELVYTTLMARDKFLAPNLNFSRLDAECPLISIVRETTPASLRLAASHSFGFGGTNAVLVADYRPHP